MAGPQVQLRDVTPADRDRLRVWRNQPDVAQWMYTDAQISEADHARWFAAALSDSTRRYWIIELDGEPVGLANLADISEANSRCAWAYYLASPSVRGKGVGAYVEYWVIEHVFGPLGLSRLWCEVLVENEAVWKLHESFGFRREALLRQHVWKNGEPRDVVGLGLLAEDWTMVREASRERLRAKGYALT
ncbi:MAG: UDP-4-amino-4,6-dideoxy-N-acetyl-beta-L-altrosamine N-acetyltransferase [Phenylobacterium sp.]|nr:UDP-4-amino-4,6-dideoxy-N-acetyl-beta-L-altrosamine N-acetyltransferase [Phenylobacterium sp.]